MDVLLSYLIIFSPTTVKWSEMSFSVHKLLNRVNRKNATLCHALQIGLDGMGDVIVPKQALPTDRKPGSCMLTNFVPLQLVAHVPSQSRPIVVWKNELWRVQKYCLHLQIFPHSLMLCSYLIPIFTLKSCHIYIKDKIGCLIFDFLGSKSKMDQTWPNWISHQSKNVTIKRCHI